MDAFVRFLTVSWRFIRIDKLSQGDLLLCIGRRGEREGGHKNTFFKIRRRIGH
jgi:hypothetical protein